MKLLIENNLVQQDTPKYGAPGESIDERKCCLG